METLVGQCIDRYQIQCLLGEGGMGAVYQAYDPRLARLVAIKVMHPFYASRPEFQERFLQEGRTAAHLDHPCIVKVHDSGQANGVLYIVMEYIPGDNLRKMLNRMTAAGQELLVGEAAQLVRQVCLAIDYAHRLGILYRDIKPDNIMIKNEPYEGLPYKPILTDLGLAKLLEGIPITQEGDSLGTPAYMSPEQALGQATDARSDVYSLGILLYELTVGRLPFEIKTLAEAIRYHTKEPPPSPRFIRPELSTVLEGVILKALQKDPARRYPEARAMAAGIHDALPAKPPEAAAETLSEQNAVSLITHYQASPADVSPASIAKEFPSPPDNLAYDRIQILSIDNTIRTILVKSSSLVIGRDADCDIILDDMSVSRHHARIEFDGSQYRVIDLKSTNGVYQEGAKLLPGIPEVWTPGKTLQTGDHWLRLERSKQPYQHAREEFEQPLGLSTQVETVSGSERMAVLLEEANLKVDPGTGVVTHVTLNNQGQAADDFRVSILGIPPAWLNMPVIDVHLNPGEQQRFDLLVRPSRVPESQAGKYTLTVRITCRENPDIAVEDHAALLVNPFYQFQGALEPPKASGKEQADYKVTLRNTGNTQMSFSFKASDVEEGCRFHFDPERVVVPAGAEGSTMMRVLAKSIPFAGRPHSFRFTLEVVPDEAPEMARQLEGVFVQEVLAEPSQKVLSPLASPKEAGVSPLRQQDGLIKPRQPVFPHEAAPDEQTAALTAPETGKSRLIAAWVVLLAACILVPIITYQLLGGPIVGRIIRWFYDSNAFDGRFLDILPLAISQSIIGILLGLGAGLTLRIAEKSLSFGMFLLVILGWLISMLIPILQYLLFPIVPWRTYYSVLMGMIQGAIIGMIVLFTLRTTKITMKTSQLWSIWLVWTFTLGILTTIQGGGFLQNMIIFYFSLFIGGSWTLIQIYRSHRRAT